MQTTLSVIDRIIAELLTQGSAAVPSSGDAVNTASPAADPWLVPVGVSNRHIHLSRSDMDTLFGPGSNLTRMSALKQPGQYAAEETLVIRGPKGQIAKVRVLGPLRKETQIEVSVADGFVLGVKPPMRMSGKLEGTPGVELVGPHGTVNKDNGVIVALRHIHMSPVDAALLGLKNGQEVEVAADGIRGGVMKHVTIRAAEGSVTEMHVDVEEANGCGLSNGTLVRILKA